MRKLPAWKEKLIAAAFGVLLAIILLVIPFLNQEEAGVVESLEIQLPPASVNVYGARDVDAELCSFILDHMGAEAQNSVLEIRISGRTRYACDLGIFDPTGCVMGHCHAERVICIREEAVDRWLELWLVLWHEAAHARMYKIANFSEISDSPYELRWTKYNPKSYGYGYSQKEAEQFPRDGFFTSYGSTDWLEDVAETTAWTLFIENSHLFPQFNYLYKKVLANLRKSEYDEVYIHHLKCLLDWGIINQRTYDTVVPLLK